VYAPTETDKGGLETARHWVRLGATLHFLLWSVAGFLHNAPPLDIPEQLVWGSQWVLGTQKLPPLSSWMLEAAWQIGGMYGISMLAAGVSCTTYLLVFALGSRLMPVAQAGAGALLLSGVYYFSWPVPEFNHAMLQIPLWAAFFLVFHICLESRGRRPALAAWSALGAIFALALWAKYSSVLLGVTAGLWLLASAKGRAHLRTPGPWLGAAVAMIVIAPHLVWLVQADFSPLSYFEGRAGRGSTPLKFTVTQFIDHLPAFLLMLLAGLFARKPTAFSGQRPGENDAFLTVMGLAPLCITVLVALVLGLKLRDTWGTPMFCLSGLLLVRAVSGAASGPRLRRLARYSLVLLAAVPVCYMVFAIFGPEWRGRAQRVNWPMAAIGEEVAKACKGTIGRLPTVVAGENFLAGLAALGIDRQTSGAHRPAVVLSADLDISPWIEAEEMKRGTAFVWRVWGSQLTAPRPVGVLARRLTAKPLKPRLVEIPWPRMSHGAGLKIAIACVRVP
jgi:hypothetical protein